MMITCDQFARVMLGNEIRQGLLNNEFSLHYQQQFNDDGSIYGVEALARWYLPVFGYVSPADFIPVAEESGHILDLGEWVFGKACEQLHEWDGMGLGKLKMSINVSTAQISRQNLTEMIIVNLNKYDLSPGSLTLEITETDFFEHFKGSFKSLESIKNLGVNLALDDFGIGHSSFQWLAELPVNILKLDRSFVRNLDKSSTRFVVRRLFQMANDLGMEIVAEGVETDRQLEILKSFGSCRIQGYLLGKPMDPDLMTKKLHSKRELSLNLKPI